MFAKIVGFATGIAVFFLYFWWRGTDPVLETAAGILLSLLVGGWAWWATAGRQRTISSGIPAPAEKPGRDD